MAIYTPPSIANYNDNPAPDDGTQVADNEITWEKIKDELTDPAYVYADAVNTATAAAFGSGSATVEQIQNGSHIYEGTVGGTGDAITLTLTPTLTAYAAGQVFRFLADSSCTGGGVTLNIDGLGAKDIRTNSISDPRAGDISTNGIYTVVYDGNRFLLQNPERDTDGVFVTNSNGNPNVSDTSLDITTLTINNYETIGPTAAGSTNTWTALDSVPTGVDWIEVSVNCSVTGTAVTVSAEVFARSSGGTSSASATQFIARTTLGDGTSNAKTSATTSRGIKIPVDAAVEFEGKYTSTAGTPSISMYLTGYGWN